jgi:hypothetical protein
MATESRGKRIHEVILEASTPEEEELNLYIRIRREILRQETQAETVTPLLGRQSQSSQMNE